MNVSEVYHKLAEKLNYSPSSRLLRILEKMVAQEEGRLLLELPAQPAELAQKLGLEEEAVNSKLREFLERGVVVLTRKGYQFVREVIQLHDAGLASSEKYVDTELLDLWKEFYEAEWCQALAEQWGKSEQPMGKVIPAWKSIQGYSDISPDENIKEIMKGAELIAVVPCPCRRALRRCDAPLDVCLQFNRWAEYAINRGAGRKLSIEEALAASDLAEEAGLVHFQATMTPALAIICNCCADCCALLDPGIKYGNLDKVLTKSRYRASIDQDSCNGCQDCVERCPPGAIEMKKLPDTKKLKGVADSEKCIGCGVCAVGCTPGAITMKLALA